MRRRRRCTAAWGTGSSSPALLRGVDICVGTPGRLMDLLDRGACTTRGTRILVLDEADEMLARGFKKDIDTVLQDINKRRKAQTLLFSATLPQWGARHQRGVPARRHRRGQGHWGGQRHSAGHRPRGHGRPRA